MKKLIKITYEGKEIEVSLEVAEFLLLDERRLKAQDKKDSRHLSDKPFEGIDKYKIAGADDKTIEEKIITKINTDMLLKAISTLTPIQKSRCIFYFFLGYTYRQIAEREGVDDRAIRDSIKQAIKKIKKYF